MREREAVATIVGGDCDGFFRSVQLDDAGRPPLDIVVVDTVRRPGERFPHVLKTIEPLTYAPA